MRKQMQHPFMRPSHRTADSRRKEFHTRFSVSQLLVQEKRTGYSCGKEGWKGWVTTHHNLPVSLAGHMISQADAQLTVNMVFVS